MSSAAPSVEFDLPERRGIGTASHVMAGLGMASLLGWWFGAAPDVDGSLRSILGFVAVASLIPALLCSGRDAACRLRHDGQAWWLSGSAGDESPSQQGRISVAFDLQSAMLLRFVATDGGRSTRIRWLAVRRQDFGLRWHEWRGVVIGAAAAQGHAPPFAGIDTSG